MYEFYAKSYGKNQHILAYITIFWESIFDILKFSSEPRSNISMKPTKDVINDLKSYITGAFLES